MARFRSAARRLKHSGTRLRLRLVPNGWLSPKDRFTRDGGNRLRTEGLGLDSSDLVVDFGGYRGDWTADLRRLYDCRVRVFEPVPEFAAAINERFGTDDKVGVHAYAVAESSGTMEVHVDGDGSGAFATGEPCTVPVIGVAEVAAQLQGRIALAKLNIEGGEFDLIPAMHRAGLLMRIDRLFIQFHRVSGRSEAERDQIRSLLAQTHKCDWDYPWVWESWSRA